MHVVKTKTGWSKSELADEFEIDRRTVAKLLEGLPANGGNSTGRNPTFLIADVAYALGRYRKEGRSALASPESSDDAGIGLGEGQLHPDRLDPKSRKEWYDGEKVRKGMLREDRELLPVAEHRAGLADMARMVRNTLEGLADSVDAALIVTPEVVDLVDDVARKALDSLADEMSDEEAGVG